MSVVHISVSTSPSFYLPSDNIVWLVGPTGNTLSNIYTWSCETDHYRELPLPSATTLAWINVPLQPVLLSLDFQRRMAAQTMHFT